MSTPTRPTGLINVLLFSLFSLCFFALLSGCSKTGPAGPAGLQGSTGAQGSPGPQGPEGNANVLVDTFTLVNSQWTYNSQYYFETAPGTYTEYFTRYHDVTDSAVTSSILNTGEVMVFFVPNPIADTNQWAPLPYQFFDGSGNFTYNIVFETMPSTVRLHYFFNQLNTAAAIPTLSTYHIATYKFKIVVISGTLSTAMQKAGIDKSNYDAVSGFLDHSDLTRRPLPNRPGARGN
jgi:hypothetical protein